MTSLLPADFTQPSLQTFLRINLDGTRERDSAVILFGPGDYCALTSGVTSCKYLNNAKTPSREITRWRFLTKHVSYVNT